MYTQLPPYIPLSMCGALAGLVGGGCSEFFPVWVGAATGTSLGCVICMYKIATPENTVSLPIQEDPQPVIIDNTYIRHEYGQPKDNANVIV